VRQSYDYRHVVTLEETNLIGNVYFLSHLRWQGHCRELFLHDRAPSVIDALSDDLVLVTTHCSCQYFAELSAFDRVLVRMTLGELRQNRVLMYFEYLREGSTGVELVARGEQEIACMKRSTEGVQPTPVPEELRRALIPYGGPTGPLVVERVP
jgi:enediyne core biosynthesis thioesterase